MEKEDVKDVCERVIEEETEHVKDYVEGDYEGEVVNFLVGRVLSKTAGRADPAVANETLKELLEEEK